MDSKDIPAFLQFAYNDNYMYGIFFKFLIETGLRKGEAAALQWSDIDLKSKKVHVNKTLDFQPNNPSEMFRDPKTFNSSRTVTLRQNMVSELHTHMKYLNSNKLAIKESYKHNLNLVFCRNDGSPLPKSTLFHTFNRICKKAGLPKLSIHSTRHTHVVLMREAGVELKYIQERFSHGSDKITSEVYAHISKKIEKASIKKYEEHMGNIIK